MSSHPLYWLLFATLFIAIAFGVWSYMSTRGHEKTGGKGTSTGIGGPHDPMS